MIKSDDLIAAAFDLVAAGGRGRPRQANLRRAVSTAYYAMFHCLAAICADLLVGGEGSERSEPAWRQVYRALEHGAARQRCNRAAMIQKFPAEIQDFAEKFVLMQRRRHQADYDPEARYDKDAVLQDIIAVAEAIAKLRQVPVKDRRAFAVYLLFPLRNN